jgi:hypothetical protein
MSIQKTIKKLVPTGTGNLSTIDLLGATATKYFTERALAPYIGNGTLFSGGVKILGSQVAKAIPVAGKYVSAGMLIDGAEDVMGGLLDQLMGKGNARSLMPSNGQNANVVQII